MGAITLHKDEACRLAAHPCMALFPSSFVQGEKCDVTLVFKPCSQRPYFEDVLQVHVPNQQEQLLVRVKVSTLPFYLYSICKSSSVLFPCARMSTTCMCIAPPVLTHSLPFLLAGPLLGRGPLRGWPRVPPTP